MNSDWSPTAHNAEHGCSEGDSFDVTLAKFQANALVESLDGTY